ncbi:MAG: hypothetical protein SF097_22595 [Acidobacteriota bacterium]|nr:hypothetical protein [Acidobacteriota bacterium]
MKALQKLFFALAISSSLALTGLAGTQNWYQQGKPPEKVKEKEKEPPKQPEKKDKDRGGGRDDKKSGDKKKPDNL